MSEVKKWAERDAREEAHETPHERISALRDAILADTSPASQERDVQDAVAREIERWEALAATAKAAEITVPQQVADIAIQALHGLLARLRSGSEPGDGVKWEEHGVTPSNPERWKGYKGVGGEGGERGWSVDRPRGSITDLTEDEAHAHAQILNSNGRGPADVIRPDGTYDAEHDDPPPGGEGGNLPEYTATEDQTQDPHDPPQGPTSDDMRAVPFSGFPNGMFDDDPPSVGEGAPEPDGWITQDEAAQVRKDRAAWLSVSVWPYRMEGDGDLPVYIDRLPPEREAEALEAAVSLMADREAEIRADERRKSQTKVEAREPDGMLLYNKHGISEVEWREGRDPKSRGMEREWRPIWFGSPNRSDEP